MSIVKMKEVTICGLLRDRDHVLGKLQDLSILHIKSFSEKKNDVADRINALKMDLIKIKRVESIIESREVSKSSVTHSDVGDLRLTVNKILSLNKERVANSSKLSAVKKHIDLLEPWGDFDLNAISKLKDSGFQITLSVFSHMDWGSLSKEGLSYRIIHKTDSKLWVAFVSSLDFSIRCVKEKLPLKKLSDFIKERDEIELKIKEINGLIDSMAAIKYKIDNLRRLTVDQINYFYAYESTMTYGPVFFIRGFIPSDSSVGFQDEMRDLKITLSLKDPGDNDDVPVKLKNNWFFSGFEGILKSFTGVSYYEKDATWSVGILFITFASLCLLDAGYSILLSLTGLLIYKKGFQLMGRVFAITGVFSLFLGLLSGQFFGFIVGEHIFQDSQPVLALSTTPLSCLTFSLCVGVVVMLFSYMVAIWQFGLKTPNTGGLFFLISLIFFTFGNLYPAAIQGYLLKLGMFDIQIEALEALLRNLGYICILLTLILWILYPENAFGEDSRVPNISWTIYSGATGVIQDILSHMRLFGVALSGGILALVVNKVATMMPFFGAVIFAIICHIAVYCMAIISMYVHTNRLIFLEFGKNCLHGGNIYYTPLSRSLLK
jgi:V/A-type H+-transporting ATPase subunit I